MKQDADGMRRRGEVKIDDLDNGITAKTPPVTPRKRVEM